jgi:uncharacterized membrane protein
MQIILKSQDVAKRKEKKMFNNAGRKIKGYATFVTILGIIFSVIGAIAVWSASSYAYSSASGSMVAAGFLVLIGGIAFSWVGGLMVYGFGQLVDDTQAIRQNIGR